MSIRSITVQYIGNVLFLPKLERDVKLVVERDYGTADPDKRFVMERTCQVAASYSPSDMNEQAEWYFAFTCGCELYWDESEPPNYCPNCGAKVVGA